MELNKKVLVGTIGYHLLSNHSIGPILLSHLQKLNWPNGIQVDELNWGPIAIVQQFKALEIPYSRVVLLAAIERNERQIGEINIYQWKGGLPDEKQIQACIGDAATGVISLENLLVIGEHFGIWPNKIYVVDVEPGPEKSGLQLSPEVEVKIPEILETIYLIATERYTEKEKFEILRGNDLFQKVHNL